MAKTEDRAMTEDELLFVLGVLFVALELWTIIGADDPLGPPEREQARTGPDALGCNRAPLKSSSGTVYAHCDACTRALLRNAFAPVSWHARARAGCLPTLIVDGIPA